MAKRSPKHGGDQTLMALGNSIRSVRRKVYLSQEGLALEAQLDRSYVGGVERGEHNLTLINLCKIADSLGLTPSDLLRDAGL